jgi:hypothetical protein
VNSIFEALSRELEEDYHQDLLAKGNLSPKRKSSEWTGEHNWTSVGYYARFTSHSCKRCETRVNTLDGLFLAETNKRGDTRSTRIEKEPPGGSWRTEIRETSLPFCAYCVEGFYPLPPSL